MAANVITEYTHLQLSLQVLQRNSFLWIRKEIDELKIAKLKEGKFKKQRTNSTWVPIN